MFVCVTLSELLLAIRIRRIKQAKNMSTLQEKGIMETHARLIQFLGATIAGKM